MNYKELADILTATNESLQHSLATQTATNESLQRSLAAQTATIASLTNEIAELRAIIAQMNGKNERLAGKLNGLTKISLPKKSERRNYVDTTLTEATCAPSPKERGNNGAKRRVHENLEEVVEDIYPNEAEGLSPQQKELLITMREVVRYRYIPPRLIKHIYRLKGYAVEGVMYSAKAPTAPLFNSNYDVSIIANLIQQRFVYGLPIERIVKQYNELGIDLRKQTAHGLLAKVSDILDRLRPVMRDAILAHDYIHFDETYHTILDKSSQGGSRKGYFWAAMSGDKRLMQFFTSEGSRARRVFTNYLPLTYSGAVQTDGYSVYKVVEGWDYPRSKRLGCVQHCKRKFLDSENQPEAKEIIDLYNEFYHIRHTMQKERWVEESLKVYHRLESALRALEKRRDRVGNTLLSNATTYCLNELEGIYHIITSTQYDLDNNHIERPMRYISISRKNSMFCGSMKGAERMAMIYSLAISCKLNGLNSFTYFCDIISRLAALPPSVSDERLRELLPDRWGDD